MRGYIGVTAREWFAFLMSTPRNKEINFWRKNKNQFNALTRGEPFYFLVKNEQGVKRERQVLGKATFERFEVLSVDVAWEKYGQGNGDPDKGSFLSRMEDMFGKSLPKSDEIGCIILSDFIPFDNPVYLSDLGIEFQNTIVSGKGIRETEIDALNAYGILDNSPGEADLIADQEGFPEGRVLFRQHLLRERNEKLIRLAKEQFLHEHGRLICEICGFDFAEKYGDTGEGYIEAHHTKPVSQMQEGEKTRIEDIVLVCANCHRMLHRRRPWLRTDELKQLLNETKD